MSSDTALLDMNVLIYAFDATSPHHVPCRRLLTGAEACAETFALAPQNLAEFCAVVTNPRRVGKPLRLEESLEAIEYLLGLPGLIVLDTPRDVIGRLVDLLRRGRITGPRVFDVMLVAMMLGNGLRCVYTFKVRDFSTFSEIEVVVPGQARPMDRK